MDYFDIFSPIEKYAIIRIVLTITLLKNWQLRQLDVNNVFLIGDLSEDVSSSLMDLKFHLPIWFAN